MRRLLSVAAVGTSITLLAACGGGGSTSTATTPGATAASSAAASTGGYNEQVTVPLSAPLATINPMTDVFAGYAVYQTMFQSLVDTTDPTGPAPSLAKSWETSTDGLTWTFHLDPSAKFSDGTQVTSADVLYTMQSMRAADSPYAGGMSIVTGVEAPDPETFVFHINKPNSAFLQVGGTKWILPAAYYKKVGAVGFSSKPVGSGPFMFESAVSGGGVVVKTNPYFTGTKQHWSRITYTPVPSAQAQISGLQSGALSVVQNVSSATVDQLKSDPNVTVDDIAGSNIIFMAFDARLSGPTSNIHFRKAISLAIDRSAMVKSIFSGHAQVATGFISPPMTGYSASRPAPTFDVTEAKKELAMSGYKGQKIDLAYPTSVLVNPDLVSNALSSFFSDIGVKVNLIPMDYSTFLTKWTTKQLPAMYLMQYSNAIDPDVILRNFSNSTDRAMFTDQMAADLFTKTRSVTGADRNTALQALQTYLFDTKQYYTPIITPDAIFGVRKGVAFQPTAVGMPYLTRKHP